MNKKIVERWFENHIATFTDTGDIKIIDFKKPGSNENRIRFLFEEDYYKLHISGDLGHLTATNERNMTYEGFHQFVNNPGYFMEKVNCHDRPFFTYDLEKARKDIVQYINEHDLADYCIEEYGNWNDYKGVVLKNAAINAMADEILEDFDYETGVSREGWKKLEDMYPDSFEAVSHFGRIDTDIIEIYLYAFKIAKQHLDRVYKQNTRK